MKIYNSKTRQKEEFKSINKGKVGMYFCGPTVYDVGHLGHGRSAVSADVIRKYFEYKGYEVTYVFNYTDVEDKIIKRAQERGITEKELVDEITPLYREDYATLGVKEPTHNPFVSDYIEKMVEIVKDLEEKGIAYELDDGVYFDVTKFDEYGALSNQKLEDLQAGARVDVKQEKRNHQDFVLWKKSKPGEPTWDSPWGPGRPGWHIECSAMGIELLGDQFDIHGGGEDLKFPHHECEIAQSKCFTGKDPVNYWIHNGFINVNNEKMSKSLGNFTTMRDVFKNYDGRTVRFAFTQIHHRNPINFTEDFLEQAKNGLSRIDDFWRSLENVHGQGVEIEDVLETAVEGFVEAMDDDFEVSRAWAAIFGLIKDVNRLRDDLNAENVSLIKDTFEKFDSVLGFLPEDQELDEELMDLIKEREEARANKDWAKSDELRDVLYKKGVQVEDTPQGTVWKRV